MAEIKVTPKELRNKAQEMANFNKQFRSEVEKMIGYRTELDSMWDGEARAAFDKAFDTDKGKWDIFARNIDDYVQKMLETAETYETAEENAIITASTRNS